MHNTPQKNKEFQIQFCRTNLSYLLGEDQKDPEIIRKIEYMRSEIARLTNQN
jgi:hypothetical protein